MSTPTTPDLGRGRVVLMASIFVIAACGLGYELVAGTMSSYLLGNSVTQFSVVIGLFLTAMGIGSYASRFITRNLLRAFLTVEIVLGVVGGLSALGLFVGFATTDAYQILLIGVCMVVGALVGLEIPLLVRIVRKHTTLKDALGNVLSLDYLGALGASLLFPLLFVPNLGLVRTAAVFGLLNLLVAGVGLWVFRRQLGPSRGLTLALALSVCAVATTFVTAGRTTSLLEDILYDDEIIYAETTPYQRLVVTRWRGDIRLFINGNIQLSSVDEYRYHEPLVHPAMSAAGSPRRVLILGGGDGLAAREVLKHASVERVDVVDLDPAVPRLFREVELLAELNRGALSDPRVEVTASDAMTFLENATAEWDVVIADLPDPNDEGLGKLYTRSFYRLVFRHLRADGVFVTQATSPYYATDAFWCIHNTLAATTQSSAGGPVFATPLRTYVPSFGEWGFVMAARRPIEPGRLAVDVPTRYLSADLLPTLFVFARDQVRRKTPINTLDDQVLIRMYRDGYRQFH